MFNYADLTPEMIARFWSKVDRSGGDDACWPYMGGRKKAGYGTFFPKRETPGGKGKVIFVNTHKFAYVITYGLPPAGHIVRHRCDNPPCCNPRHLVSGTQKDNMQDVVDRCRFDFVAHGRRNAAIIRDRAIANRQLTELDIAHIIVARSQGHSCMSIARDYPVTSALISQIFQGTCYQNVQLVQQLGELYRQGIRFLYCRGNTTADQNHPTLKSIAAVALQIVEEAWARPTMPRLIKKSRDVVLAKMDELF